VAADASSGVWAGDCDVSSADSAGRDGATTATDGHEAEGSAGVEPAVAGEAARGRGGGGKAGIGTAAHSSSARALPVAGANSNSDASTFPERGGGG